ncbi:unnamed protein product [Vicia faba]|uniref:Replication factor A C-terminal domain-containing protein n=1 Tax=Vicia faba TaxID=3906 RepID=A0AAV1A435_VICFA|nr:unnamed protein product [Vicia faba]
MNHKDDGNIVILLINARIKEPRGYPLNVSSSWNGTKLLINDVTIEEINKLKEGLKNDLTLLSSSLQIDATHNSQFFEFDKFVWKAEILHLSEINLQQHETTCVTMAKLEKFECGQSGWYYDGCVDCTKSVTLKDGKLTCYSKHASAEAVPRYVLEVLSSDGKFKYKFIFWDVDCVKLIGKSSLQIKMDLIESGDYDPLEFPYELDAILQKELAIRVVFHPNKHTSKLQTLDLSSHDELITIFENLSASADYDPAVPITGLTPSKRSLSDAVGDFESVQLSSTKITKDIKMEK